MGRPAILKVDIVADARGVGPGVSEAESKLSRFGKRAAQVGKLAAVGLGVGLAAAGAAAVKLAQGAIEDQQAAARLADTLKKATGATDGQVAATERWISKQGAALGIADDELRPALSKLAVATGDVGKAQQAASLAMDVAAGTGKSLEAVSAALARAYQGNTAGLGRLGVATKDAAGNSLTLDQITGKLAKTYGGAATTAANTAAGRFGRLKLQLSEAGEAIGYKLLPFANKLAGYLLNKGLPLVQKWGAQLGRQLGPIIRKVGAFIRDDLVPAGQRLYAWFVEKIVPGLKRTLVPILGGVRSLFDKVAGSVDDNSENLGKLGRFIGKVYEFMANKLYPILGTLIGKGFGALGTAISLTIGTISTLVGWIDSAVSAVQRLVDWLGKIKVPDLGGALGKLGGLVGFGAEGITRGGVRLVGRSSSLDPRQGYTTAAMGLTSLVPAVRTAAGGAAVVDARTYLTVQVDGSGIVDEAAVARKLEQVLRRHAARLGRPVAVIGG